MKKVNIVLGRFQPFTKGHYKCVEEAWRQKNLPSVICIINTPENKVDERHPFPSDMLIDLYKDWFDADEKIESIILVPNADIVKIAEELKKHRYQIGSWTCGTDRIKDYTRISTNYKEQAELSDDFEMIEVKRGDDDISATKARQALKDDDRTEFNKLVPVIHLGTRLKNDIFAILRDQLLKVLK